MAEAEVAGFLENDINENRGKVKITDRSHRATSETIVVIIRRICFDRRALEVLQLSWRSNLGSLNWFDFVAKSFELWINPSRVSRDWVRHLDHRS